MPVLDSPLYLNQLQNARKNGQPQRDGLYGLHWGDPNTSPFLKFIRNHYIYPYIHPEHTAVEIGPGGGRWTRYLLSFGRVYVVDYLQEMVDEIRLNFKAPHLFALKNNGTDFPGIEPGSVDFVFSYDVFVHLDPDVINGYLENLKSIMRPGGNIILHYGDKNKKMAQDNKGFSNNKPELMRALVLNHGYVILEENLTLVPHSAIMRFAVDRTGAVEQSQKIASVLPVP